MYRRLTNPKLLRRLSYRRIVVYNVIGNGYGPFLNILLHRATPENVFYILLNNQNFYNRIASLFLSIINFVLSFSFINSAPPLIHFLFFFSPPCSLFANPIFPASSLCP